MPQEVSADEQRRLLEDPHVSGENKSEILGEMVQDGNMTFDEAMRYAEDNGINAGGVILSQTVAGGFVDGDGAAASARTESGKGAAADGKRALESGGFSNSDEIIDSAEPGLQIFDDFYPLYEEASSAVGGGAPQSASRDSYSGPVTPGSGGGAAGPAGSGMSGGGVYSHTGIDPQSLRAGLDEFRGIEFSAFHADADMLKNAEKSVDESTEALDKAWSSNLSGWGGEGASAAGQRRASIVKGAGTLSQALHTAPDSITTTVDDYIKQNVTDFANRIVDMYGDGKMAEMTPEEVRGALDSLEALPPYIEALNKKIEELNDRNWLEEAAAAVVNFFASGWGFIFGGPILWFASKMALELEQVTEDNIVAQRDKVQALLNSANEKLGQFIGEYGTRAGEVHSQASTYVSAIQECYTSLIESLNSGLEQDPFADKGAGGKEQQPGGGGGPSGGGGGAPSGGGGGAPSGGGGGMPKPEDLKPPEAEKPEGMNPVTGKPLERNPETGEPYPIDPETGEAIKDVQGDQDTMTVQHGDKEISITEPDKDGKMDITIEGEDGKAKDYKLDFGPEGAKDGEQVYKPGPDGKIHIEDGDLKITAEQPDGPDGPTVVTVDDGKGEPHTYTLGDKEAVETYNERPSQLGAERDSTAKAGAEDVRSQPAGVVGGQDGGSAGGAGGSGGTAEAGGGSGGESGHSGASGGGATHPAADFGAGGGGGATSIGGGDAGGAGLGDTSSLQAGPQSGMASPQPGAGLGSAPGGEHAPAAAASSGGSAAGGAAGGGMMGGGMMGGGGAAGGGGEDQERRSAAYRIDGGLFEDGPEQSSGMARITGALGLDE